MTRRSKERPGRALAWTLAAACLGACASRSAARPTGTVPRPTAYLRTRVPELVEATRSPSPEARRAALRDLARAGGPDAARVLLGHVADADPAVAAEAAFGACVTGTPGVADDLLAALPADAPDAVVEAAALGLGSLAGDDAERALYALMRRPGPPRAVPGALLSHYRWRGRPAPATLPDDAALAYASHADAEGRAGLGHLARAVKDPRLLPALTRLAADSEWEVRVAAAAGLARSGAAPWDETATRANVELLVGMTRDADAHVVVAAVRGLASYGAGAAAPGSDAPAVAAPVVDAARAAVRGALAHADFNVRVAACESSAAGRDTAAVADLARLARGDASVSVRYAAATSAAKLDAAAAQELVDTLLADPSEYVRSGGADVLAAAPEEQADAATARLIALAQGDPHVRVRESALDALGGRKGDVVTEAVRRELVSGTDPVLVSVAAGAAVKNGATELVPEIRAALARFAGRSGADAREGLLGALAELGSSADRALVESYLADPHPSVAAAATATLAAWAGTAAPAPARSAASGVESGDLAPVAGPVGLEIVTSRGTLRVALYPELAPLHVAHVVALARRGFYDGLTWHRVVPDFVIQGACPRGDGAGSAGVTLPLEPTLLRYERGVLGMPRSGHPDSGGCQLFFMHCRAPHLDVHYTAFGRVIEGLDVIDRIDVDDRIETVRVTARDGTGGAGGGGAGSGGAGTPR